MDKEEDSDAEFSTPTLKAKKSKVQVGEDDEDVVQKENVGGSSGAKRRTVPARASAKRATFLGPESSDDEY